MKQRLHLVRFVLAIGVLALSAAGCQGGSPSSTQYAPSSTGAAPSLMTGGTSSPDSKKKPKIISSCGEHIRIVLLAIQDCRFHELRYSGKFKITNNTNGLIGISPSSGTKKTVFTVTGLLIGSGYFLVEDRQGNKLKVYVKVVSS